MVKVVREFKGHSGSKIFLMEGGASLFVRKIGNVQRNFERLSFLKDRVRVPKVYLYENDVLDMEYIHGMDMKTYLLNHDIDPLVTFIEGFIRGQRSSRRISFTSILHHELSWLEGFPFDRDQLIGNRPLCLPFTDDYHGDLTLENIIYTGSEFVLIDPVTVPYASPVFDLAKLRQDLECRWFLRNSDVRLDTKLNTIQERLFESFPIMKKNTFLIAMLLRVYRHCEKNSVEHRFIVNHINRLWSK